MKFRDMQYILTLAEYRNFTKASKELFISQPSLSAIISRVEEELNVTLFERSTQPLTLTYAGEVFVEQAAIIMESVHLLEKRMGEISEQREGRILVGFPTERASWMMPTIISEFRQTHPRTELVITTGNTNYLLELLLANRLDMCVVANSTCREETIQRELYWEELFLVASEDVIKPEHLVEGMPDTVDILKMQDVPLIVLDPRRAIRGFVDDLYKKNGMTPRIVMQTTNNSAAFRLATAGIGAAIVPALTVDMIHEVRKTPVYRIGSGGTFWQIQVVQRKDAYVTQMERDLISTMRNLFGGSRAKQTL